MNNSTTAPWKTYDQYFADNPDALKSGQVNILGAMPGTREGDILSKHGGASAKYALDYNKYRSTLSPEYQYLSGAGITPEAVSSGAVTGYHDWKQGGKLVKVGQGTPEAMAQTAAAAGSSHALSPDILAKMWR